MSHTILSRIIFISSNPADLIDCHAEDIIKMKRRLNDIYVRHTGQTYETIEKSLDRDYFLSAEDARTFGIVDEVITKRHPLDEKVQKLMPVS